MTDKTVPDKKPKFDLNFLFETSCWDPDDHEIHEKWTESPEEPSYPGWRRYNITTHCQTFTVIAKKAKNGGWHIKDYIVKDH